MKLLLAEDGTRTEGSLKKLLQMEGYDVDRVSDGEAALAAISDGVYDVVILDITMPEMNGLAEIKHVRQSGISVPILLLSNKTTLRDKVEGLDSGADDYLTKPFMDEELLARLRALTRRHANDGQRAEGLCFGDIVLNPKTAMLSCTSNDSSVRLTDKEYHLLEYMMLHRGEIVSREKLAVKVWGYNSDAEYNNVEVYLSFTRKKLASIHAKTRIKAIRGIGYELQYE